MPNFVPYLLLSLMAVCTMGYLVVRTRSYYPVVLFFAFSGMIYLFEYFILVLFRAYRYMPGVLENPAYDSMAGALVSNLLTIPSIAAALIILKLRKRWILFFALFLTGVEWLFLRLDIFEHYWWKLPFTTINIAFFLSLAVYWSKRLEKGGGFIRYLTILMLALSIIDTLAIALLFTGLRSFDFPLLGNASWNNMAVTLPYSLFKALLFTSAVYWTKRLYPLLLTLALVFLINVWLLRIGFMTLSVDEWLYYLIYFPGSLLCTLIVYWTRRWFRRRATASEVK
ncbi:hypothetical protein [Paenibacillus soyae]|uniref:Uncharacterized protein n=1 Tax=Paenibacillus soyae TaxID=2969249 RepID=A0A9X2SBB7_9BACL|nr:hypothetical protein [Paenibacillus soyae]MCR2806900.1 hypothetical protein [Paenibacillus soyae]